MPDGVQLLNGYIIFLTSSALNDFEAMNAGTCTTLTGYTLTGDATFTPAFFKPR